MQKQFNSLSETLKYFSNLSEQTIKILININNAMFTSDQAITISLTQNDGTINKYSVPSFTYINKKLAEIDLNLKKIQNAGKRASNMPLFSQEKVSEPAIIKNVQFPKEFYAKPNLFFENLLNPLLYIKIDVSDYVLPDTKQLMCRRILLKFNDSELLKWFDDNFAEKTDLIYDDVISLINKKGIQYNIDDEILNLPPFTLQYSGNFDIIQVYSDIYNNSNYSYIKKYKLSSLTYKDNTTGANISLKVGDLLIMQNGESDYEVIEITDSTNNLIVLGLKSGFDIIEPGIDVLSIASDPIGEKYFEMPITYDENQIIFLKAISPYFHSVCNDFGYGFGFKSKDLTIQTDNGQFDFNTYYLTKTFDYGKQFTHLESEKTIPISYALTPNRPNLTVSNFEVKIINQQRFTTSIDQKVSQVLAQKQLLEEQKTEFTNKILEIDTELQTSVLTQTQIDILKSEQNQYIIDLATTIEQIETNTKEIFNYFNFFNEDIKPKYRIVGAFPIPEPVYDAITGYQYVVAFNIRYRYLTNDNKIIPAEKYTYTDINGNSVTLTDPNWICYSTNSRSRLTDYNNQLSWSDIDDPINKIQIPINSSESVEFQIQSISEVGFPNYKFVSDWSAPLIITFPDDKFATDEYTLTYKSLLSEYFKNEYFKELTDLRKITTILSKNLESLEERVINLSQI